MVALEAEPHDSTEPHDPENEADTTLRFASGASVIATIAEFGPQAVRLEQVAAVRAEPSLANEELTNPTKLAGAIAVVDRGDNYIEEKALRVQAAGAVALIVVDTDIYDAQARRSLTPMTYLPKADNSQSAKVRIPCARSQLSSWLTLADGRVYSRLALSALFLTALGGRW